MSTHLFRTNPRLEVKSSVVVDADGNFQISFVPTQSGDYSVDISLVDKNGLGVSVKGSPFKINVSLKPVAPGVWNTAQV